MAGWWNREPQGWEFVLWVAAILAIVGLIAFLLLSVGLQQKTETHTTQPQVTYSTPGA